MNVFSGMVTRGQRQCLEDVASIFASGLTSTCWGLPIGSKNLPPALFHRVVVYLISTANISTSSSITASPSSRGHRRREWSAVSEEWRPHAPLWSAFPDTTFPDVLCKFHTFECVKFTQDRCKFSFGRKVSCVKNHNPIISCYAKCARTCWHTKVYAGWLVVL